MDFGYTNDPTALVRAGIYQGGIYAEELIYERGLSAAEIANIAHHKGYQNIFRIMADNEPRTIAALEEEGLWIEGARKVPGSVALGISTRKTHTTMRTKWT